MLSELYDIFLSRAKERWKSFSETSSETETEGKGFFITYVQTVSLTICTI